MKMFAVLVMLFSTCLYAEEAKKDLALKDLSLAQDEVGVKQSALIGTGNKDVFTKMNYSTAALVVGALLTGREGKATEEHRMFGAAAGSFFTAQTLFIKPNEGGWKASDVAYYVATPLLMLAPILGGKRASDIDHNRASKGLVKDHKTIATVGAVTYLLSVALWTFNF